MKFNNLKERMLYFRSMTDYRLIPNSYIIIMIDGRAFSKLIKNNYEKPFDKKFVSMMNEVACYLMKNIQNCKFAYTQSDEISLVLTDFDTIETDSFFGYRLSKLLSIIPSMASSRFNQLVSENILNESESMEEAKELIKNMKLADFDCKAWNVPSFNDVYSWILYRQIDCVRNSKQQTAQTYLTHKELLNKTCDEQIQLLKEQKNIDWNLMTDDVKFGRFIYKDIIINEHNKEIKNINVHDAFPLNDENGKDKLINLNIIPKIE